VEIPAEILCPWCGQSGQVMVDTSIATQRWVVDCEVCCRPISVSAECGDGEILSLDVEPG
jgi:hypothetical protein